MVTITEMKEKEVDLGKLVEITLYKNAEFYDGYTPAPTTNPMGYDFGENMTAEPGSRHVGYVHKINDQRITLAMGINQNNETLSASFGENHFLYFDEKAIHSYRVL